MENNGKPKGTWINRFAVRFFTVVLAVLFFWLIGFLLQDIRTIKGPDYEAVEKTTLDNRLLEKESLLEKQIGALIMLHMWAEHPFLRTKAGMALDLLLT